jgi:hypothetical protein
MLRRLALLCVLPLVLSTGSFAQNINDFLRTFGGVVQQALRQAAHSEWQKVPPAEFSCLEQKLRQQGETSMTWQIAASCQPIRDWRSCDPVVEANSPRVLSPPLPNRPLT